MSGPNLKTPVFKVDSIAMVRNLPSEWAGISSAKMARMISLDHFTAPDFNQ
jgi:hypothetical protein